VIVAERNGKTYRLPSDLTDFQERMYIHLIDWKRENITCKAGKFKGIEYDAILPEEEKAKKQPIYQPVVPYLRRHHTKFRFKYHKFAGHMASSQAACANLFLPILKDPELGAKVLAALKPDLRVIETRLPNFDSGYRLEFWGDHQEILKDHSPVSGTDADIAIAYHDQNGDLCLWLIEHKLTEKEFTPCGGFKSPGKTKQYSCESAADILVDRDKCYYHGACRYRYWDVTLESGFFSLENIRRHVDCPFKSGMNQLWRNQLLGLSIENLRLPDLPFKKTFFSVVNHPDNHVLTPILRDYGGLVNHADRFSYFTSDKLVEAAKSSNDPFLNDWGSWYEGLYYLPATELRASIV